MDTSVAAVTVSVAAGDDTLPRVALTWVTPVPAADARPAEPAALLMAATVGSEEAQVTCEVRFWVDLSENTPVAWNCAVVPFATFGLGGVTSIAVRTAGVTAKVVWPIMPALLAEIVVEPALRPLASPPLLTVAVCILEEAQATFEVMSRWVLSLKIAVAVNCAVVPAATCALLGVTSIDCIVAGAVAL